MSNKEDRSHPGLGDVSCQLSLDLSSTDGEKEVILNRVTLLYFLLMQLSCPMEAWKKSGLWIWKWSHSPAGLIFLMIPPSSQPHTTVGTLKAIPWKPAVRLFHGAQGATQASWKGPGPDSQQMSPPPPYSSEPKPSFQGLLLLPRFTGPQKCARCWTKRKRHISLTAGLRDRHQSMWRWPKTQRERPKKTPASL